MKIELYEWLRSYNNTYPPYQRKYSAGEFFNIEVKKFWNFVKIPKVRQISLPKAYKFGIIFWTYKYE